MDLNSLEYVNPIAAIVTETDVAPDIAQNDNKDPESEFEPTKDPLENEEKTE